MILRQFMGPGAPTEPRTDCYICESRTHIAKECPHRGRALQHCPDCEHLVWMHGMSGPGIEPCGCCDGEKR